MSSPARPPHPPIGRVFNPSNIPAELKALDRWAVWRAAWNDKRGKWDKIPHHPITGAGLSTKDASAWCDFRTALDALLEHPDRYTGLGLVLTGATDLVGIDIDDCIGPNMEPNETAREILRALRRGPQDPYPYTEISPSGCGVRILGWGNMPSDFVNHEVGVEAYNGHSPRFLTVTGDVRGAYLNRSFGKLPEAKLSWLQDTYRRKPSVTSVTAAPVISIEVPEVVEEALLPTLDELQASGLSAGALQFLREGTSEAGDASLALHTAGIHLLELGLSQAEAFSVLAHAAPAAEVALAHRSHDWDRALQYLWVEHVQKALPKARTPEKILADFEDCSEGPGGAPGEAPGAPDAPGQPKAPGAGQQAPGGPKSKFTLQGFEAFTRPRKVAWIIKRLLPPASLGVLFGAPGAGKSFLVLDLVAAVARGIDWCGHRIAERHRVVYVAAEGQEDFRRRASAYALAAGTAGQPNGGMDLYFIDEAPNLLEVGDARELARQIAACPGGKPALVVLDTLAQVMVGGNENSSEDVGKVLKHCRLIERATGAMVLLVAHTGKDETRGLRGWSGVRGAADFEMEVVREGHDRVATLTKLKGGEEGLAFPFRLKPVVLGQDEDGDDITSCVVEHVQEMPERHLDAKSLAQQAVLQSLEQIHAMTDEWPTQNELLQVAASKLPEEEDGRDRRRSSCSRALSTYISRGEIVRDAQGRLHVARRGEQPLP